MYTNEIRLEVEHPPKEKLIKGDGAKAAQLMHATFSPI